VGHNRHHHHHHHHYHHHQQQQQQHHVTGKELEGSSLFGLPNVSLNGHSCFLNADCCSSEIDLFSFCSYGGCISFLNPEQWS
jgi:hypothetical protein